MEQAGHRYRRWIASVGVSTVIASFAFATAMEGSAGAASTPFPAAAKTVIQLSFDADANAQLDGGANGIAPTTASASPAGTQDLNALETQDAAAAAAAMKASGFEWDTDSVTLTKAVETGTTNGVTSGTVNVEEYFHIMGAATDGTPATYSSEVLPFNVSLVNYNGNWTLTSVAQTSTASEPSPGSPGTSPGPNQPPPPSSFPPPGNGAATTVSPDFYNGNAAVAYAGHWWDSVNPQYEFFSDDCMNFGSQILNAGGENTGSVWFPYSSPWDNVTSFFDEGTRLWDSPDGYATHFKNGDSSLISPGDLLAWDWGDDPANEPFEHEMFVDGKNGNTLMLSAHTIDRWNWPSTYVFHQYPNAFFVVERSNA